MASDTITCPIKATDRNTSRCNVKFFAQEIIQMYEAISATLKCYSEMSIRDTDTAEFVNIKKKRIDNFQMEGHFFGFNLP